MTTETKGERVLIVAQLVRKGEEQKGSKTVTVFEFKDKPDQQQYGTKVTCWPSKEGAPSPVLDIGKWYEVWFDQRPVPKRPDGTGGKGYFRDFVSAMPATGRPPGVQQPLAPTGSTVADAAEPEQAEPAAPQLDAYTQAELRRERSIQRQVALKAAVEITTAQIAATEPRQPGDKQDRWSYHTAQVADFFARWLAGEREVKSLERQAQEEKAQAQGATAALPTVFPEGTIAR